MTVATKRRAARSASNLVRHRFDVNLLIYATFENTVQHRVAREWVKAQFNNSIRVGLPWSRLLGYLRISTNPRAFAGAIKMRDAWKWQNPLEAQS